MRKWSAVRGMKRGAGWLSAMVLLTHCGGGMEPGAEPGAERAVKSSVEDCQTVTRYEDHVVHARGDAYVVASQPNASFGTEHQVLVDGDPRMEGYLSFGLSAADFQQAAVSRAVLRLYAFDGSSDGPALYRTADGWNPETVTWNTRPALVGGPIADVGAVSTNSHVDFDVTSVVRGAGTYSFGLVPTSGNGVDFYSRDQTAPLQAPRLILTLARTYCERRGTGGDTVWARQRGGDGYESLQALATDASGNFVIAGRYSGSGNFGGATFGSEHLLVLAKYGPDGAHQWSRVHAPWSPGSGLTVENITLSPLGNILVAGYYQGAPDLGAGPLPATGSHDSYGVFIAKFSPSGGFVWARGFVPRLATPGAPYSANAWARAVATDANGSLYFSGAFLGRINLGGGELDSGSTQEESGLFLAKYSWEGDHVWSVALPAGTGGTEVGDMVSTAGLLFVSGHTGPGGLLNASAPSTPYVAAFSADNGVLRWSRPLNGATGSVTALAVLPEGRVAFGGYFDGTISFGGTTYTCVDPPSPYFHVDMMLGTLTATNGSGWFRHFASTGSEFLRDLAADTAGNVYAHGFSFGDVDLGGGGTLGHPTLTSPFVAKYDRVGGHRWSRLLDPALLFRRVAATPNGEALVGGEFNQPATMDGTRYTPRNDDLLFLKLGP